MKDLAMVDVQNFSILLEAKMKKFKEMEINIAECNEQISTLSKEISALRESSRTALDENKIMKETVRQKESKIKLLMKTNDQLQMENYDEKKARKLENNDKDVIIKALAVEIGSIKKEKECVEEELCYTLEELEVVRNNPIQTTKNHEVSSIKLEERNDELSKTNNLKERLKEKDILNSELKSKLKESENKQKEMEGKYVNEILSLEKTIRLLRTEGSSGSGTTDTDNGNDSIDDLLKSDSEDEDHDRSCSIREVKVFRKTLKGKRSAEEELYSSKIKKGRDTDLLKLIDLEMNKMKTSIRQ